MALTALGVATRGLLSGGEAADPLAMATLGYMGGGGGGTVEVVVETRDEVVILSRPAAVPWIWLDRVAMVETDEQSLRVVETLSAVLDAVETSEITIRALPDVSQWDAVIVQVHEVPPEGWD